MIEAYPLNWPTNKLRTPEEKRKAAQFKMKNKNGAFTELSVAEAVTRVKNELYSYTKHGHTLRVPPNSIIISTNVPTNRDGTPSSSYRNPDDPGVAVYFILDKVQYCLPCDSWFRVADNIAAVAAHISALRGIERWGVGSSHDAYSGYTALPEQSTVISFWDILGLAPGSSEEDVKQAYKSKAKTAHPDGGGSIAAFDTLTKAYKQALSQFK